MKWNPGPADTGRVWHAYDVLDWFGRFMGSPALDPTGWLARFCLTSYLLVVIHEVGHVVAARHVGLTPRAIIVGPRPRFHLRVHRVDVELSVIPLGGGRMTCEPGRASARQDLVLAAGGPVANLLTALLAVPLAIVLHSALLGILSVNSISIMLWNLQPRQTPAGPTDGARIRDARRAMHGFTGG